ncbi:DUF1572 family protein [Paenibacillus sp. JDR-2]|uniref:DUF1572 family protein n=1 Tax=Paenibacillus sp. (strain JDR-2) TaxID=324057 RepID=UPI0001666A85|nr:DUF1572 family protein [Paenibacillus sp. JDR-2]ACT03152.1 hypothetical protein Pjdr2_4533 [Paenibacillus sp. JDR-2]
MTEITAVLKNRFDAIEKRIILVLNQLDDQQVNWRPNESSNSITNLIVHISGNINERIGMAMNNKPFSRDRDKEFETQFKTKAELIELTHTSFGEVQTALTGNREQSNLEIFIQSATHFSEHMGQILYIAKILKDEDYITTSVPKKKSL